MRTKQASLVFTFYTAILLFITPVQARHFPDELKNRLNRVTAFIYNDNFDQAGRLIDSLSNSIYRGPVTVLFRAILYQARMMTAESNFLEEEFFASLDTLADESRILIESGGDSALAYFCLGHAHAFRSLFYARNDNTWAAIKGGLRARNAYSRAYKVDSTFHDIGLGLGSYQYWKTVKTRALNWTPLFKREKDNGIRLLSRAIDSSEISSDAARTSLIWIYINEKRYGQAFRLADMMRRKYPDGLTFYWALGEISRKIGDYRMAIGTYGEILNRLRGNPGNYYNIIEAAYYLSASYRVMVRKDAAYRDSLDILQNYLEKLPIPDETASRQKNKIKDILKPLD